MGKGHGFPPEFLGQAGMGAVSAPPAIQLATCGPQDDGKIRGWAAVHRSLSHKSVSPARPTTRSMSRRSSQGGRPQPKIPMSTNHFMQFYRKDTIHFATMNRLNAPNFILTNWLYDI
jgi:hypothetical protein